MSRSLIGVLLAVCMFAMQGCDRAKRARGDEDARTIVDSSQKSGLPHSPSPPTKGSVSDEKRFVDQVVPYIKIQRNSSQPYQAVTPIRCLFTVWEPVGKSAKELEAMIGAPTLVKDGRLEYTLLDEAKGAAGGYRFVFYISDGRIVKYESDSFD